MGILEDTDKRKLNPSTEVQSKSRGQKNKKKKKTIRKEGEMHILLAESREFPTFSGKTSSYRFH